MYQKIHIIICIILAIGFGNATNIAAANDKFPIMMSTAKNKTNIRSGPDIKHPIRWSLETAQIPLKIISEYGDWRKINDWRGQQGWVYRPLLSKRKTFITTAEQTALHIEPNPESPLIAYLGKNYVGRIFHCFNGFCRVQVHDNQNREYAGWLNKKNIWGACSDDDTLGNCQK